VDIITEEAEEGDRSLRSRGLSILLNKARIRDGTRDIRCTTDDLDYRSHCI
jgi:hypothetical protein